MATSRVNVDISGPLFDGRAYADVIQWLDETKKEVARMAVLELDAVVMDKSGRATGNYQSDLRSSPTGKRGDILVDDPVQYGPWLEGVSKRNSSTRFKGYHLWRKTRTRLRRTYKDVAQERLEKYLPRMGGK